MLPPRIRALTDELAPFLTAPPAIRPGVCATCRNLITPGYRRCYRCTRQPDHCDAVVPIALSAARSRWHHMLRGYKDAATEATRSAHTEALAAVLWRFLHEHENCITAGLDRPGFDLVTTVPSKRGPRDAVRRIVERCEPTRDRYRPLLAVCGLPPARRFDAHTFSGLPEAAGAHVLLVDDTWTTGATAQSAAAALRAAGARTIVLVVLGRHVSATRLEADARLRPALSFAWDRCVFDHAAPERSSPSHASTSLR